MKKNLIIFVLILFTLLSTTTIYSKIKRSCHGYYAIQIISQGHFIPVRRFNISSFETQSKCGRLVPNRCRKRSRKKVINCLKDAFKNRNSKKIPKSCQKEAKYYPITNPADTLNQYITAEVCDYMNYFGARKKDKVQVSIKGISRGKKRCKKDMSLTSSFKINCQKRSLIKVTEKLQAVKIKSNITRYKKFKRKCFKGKCSNDLSLHFSKNHAQKSNIFEAYNIDGDDKYIGCGRKAAQNVLGYFGIKLRQKHIGKWVKGHKIGKNIATYPSELRKGIQKALDKYKYNIKVDRHSGKNQKDIINYLKRGFPVIALVQGGNHWVVITGYKSSHLGFTGKTAQNQTLFFIHNNGYNQVWNWHTIKLNFDRRSSAWYKLSNAFGGTSFKPGTIIVFKKK